MASWRQFGIRSILLLMLGIAILLGWYVNGMSRYAANQRATAALQQSGAQVEWYIQPFPQFDRVTRVALRNTGPTPEDFRVLAGLTDLAYLSLADTTTTDADIAGLRTLTSLQQLDLSGTQITDATLAEVAQWPALSVLKVERTQVTPAGLEQLAVRRPDITVTSESPAKAGP